MCAFTRKYNKTNLILNESCSAVCLNYAKGNHRMRYLIDFRLNARTELLAVLRICIAGYVCVCACSCVRGELCCMLCVSGMAFYKSQIFTDEAKWYV